MSTSRPWTFSSIRSKAAIALPVSSPVSMSFTCGTNGRVGLAVGAAPGTWGGGARTYPRPPPHHQAQKKTLCVKYQLVWISASACAPEEGFIDCGRKSTSHVLRTPTGRYLPRSFFWVWSVSRGSQVLLFKLQSSNRPIVNRQLQ